MYKDFANVVKIVIVFLNSNPIRHTCNYHNITKPGTDANINMALLFKRIT